MRLTNCTATHRHIVKGNPTSGAKVARANSMVLAALIIMMALAVVSCRSSSEQSVSETQQSHASTLATNVASVSTRLPELEHIGNLGCHTAEITCIAFNPIRNSLATGSKDGTVRVWDGMTGALLETLDLGGQVAHCLEYSPDSYLLACGAGESEDTMHGLHVWETIYWAKYPQCETNGAVLSVSWSADNSALAIEVQRAWVEDHGRGFDGNVENRAMIVIGISGEKVKSLSSVTDNFTFFHFSKENYDARRAVYDPKFGLRYSPKGHRILRPSQSPESLLDAHDLESVVSLGKYYVAGGEPSTISPDESIALTYLDGEGVILDYPSLLRGEEKVIAELGKHRFLGFLSNTQLMVMLKAHLYTLDINKPKEFVPLWKVPDLEWHSLTLSRNGRFVAAHLYDLNRIAMLDAKTGQVLWQMGGHTGASLCVASRPGFAQVASGGSDGLVCLWDLNKGSYVRTMGGVITKIVDGAEVTLSDAHTAPVNMVAFSPDGKLLASGSNDRRVIIWDADTGKLVRELKGHRHNVTSLAFTPSGKLIVTGSEDCTVRVWNVETGVQVSQHFDRSGRVSSVAVSEDGGSLRVGIEGYDNGIVRYKVASSSLPQGNAIIYERVDYPLKATFGRDGYEVWVDPNNVQNAYWKRDVRTDSWLHLGIRTPFDYTTFKVAEFDRRHETFSLTYSSVHGVPLVARREGQAIAAFWAFERVAIRAESQDTKLGTMIALVGGPNNPLQPIEVWQVKQ